LAEICTLVNVPETKISRPILELAGLAMGATTAVSWTGSVPVRLTVANLDI
jgi:hypothetical protein